MIRCSWKDTIGIDCPSCGAQRSFIHLIHGEFKESLVDFPALIPFLITIVLAICVIFKIGKIDPKWIAISFGFTALIMMVFWIFKLV